MIDTIKSLQYRSVSHITSILDHRNNHKAQISVGVSHYITNRSSKQSQASNIARCLAVRQQSIIDTITTLQNRSVSRITPIIDHRNNHKPPISFGVSHCINNCSSIQSQVSNIVRCLAVQESMIDTITSLKYRSVSRITSIIDHRNNHKAQTSFGLSHYTNTRSSKQLHIFTVV